MKKLETLHEQGHITFIEQLGVFNTI